ncbi:hypothetical protein [Bradyrhizobium sp. 604_D8_N2_3]|uniref:hypothetical protein n=1 Tax=Bradyrhizobium sp. 604_D8_N2_3 TaxID=3240370 RepID=UPI003F21DDB2
MQILVPTQTGKGEPVSTGWFDNFLQELTDRFGGATSFVRAPGQGLWRSDGTTERDTIAVLEVMAAKLAPRTRRHHRLRRPAHRPSPEQDVLPLEARTVSVNMVTVGASRPTGSRPIGLGRQGPSYASYQTRSGRETEIVANSPIEANFKGCRQRARSRAESHQLR